MKPPLFTRLIVASLLWAGGGPVHAQWLTQSFNLNSGWNAVYLHVDASHDSIANLVGANAANPITEIWLWTPGPGTRQFLQSPQQPLYASSQWATWNRTASGSSPLQRLTGNSAYLVRVGSNVTSYVWSLKGKPVPPNYQWTVSGLNFLGFPTVPASPPTFYAFLAQAPALLNSAEIYRYTGGDLGDSNPARVLAPGATPVARGQAFWIRSGEVYNRYFGPFEVTCGDKAGAQFYDNLSTYGLRLRNLTTNALTVTLKLAASETPPAGQTSIAGVPPLLVRGGLNLTNLTYGYTNLSLGGAYSWTLPGQGQSGSEIEIVLGLNRAAITNAAGAFFAGILRFTDSLGFAQIDAPVSAISASRAGLWVGNAAVTQVGEGLKSYQRDAANNLILSSNGQYVVSGVATNLGSVPRSFPVRLIVHNAAPGGAVTLLQRVYCGVDARTNSVIALQESSLNPAYLSQARRISAAHLPWTTANTPWPFSGKLAWGSNLTATVALPYDDQASNPFLHTYHPDHDNLDATFQNKLAQGSESYAVRREITLLVSPPAGDFASLTAAGQTLTGDYLETVTLLGLARAGGTNDTRRFNVRGVFSLNRISTVSALTAP